MSAITRRVPRLLRLRDGFGRANLGRREVFALTDRKPAAACVAEGNLALGSMSLGTVSRLS
jgi:hypothetical protein